MPAFRDGEPPVPAFHSCVCVAAARRGVSHLGARAVTASRAPPAPRRPLGSLSPPTLTTAAAGARTDG